MSRTTKTPPLKGRHARELSEGLRTGVLSLPYLLQVASASPEVRSWVRAQLPSGVPEHVPAVGPEGADRDAIRGALAQARRTLGRRRGVVDVHFGLKRAGGKTLDASAIVCTVAKKVHASSLPSRSLIPPHVEFNGCWFPTDVLEHRVARKQVDLSIRDGQVEGRFLGTLSAVVRVQNSMRVYLSGHVAGRAGVAIGVVLPTGERLELGKTTCWRDDGWVDSAVVADVDPAVRARLGGVMSEVRAVDGTDLRLPVVIHVNRPPGRVSTEVSDTHRRAEFSTGWMSELIELREHVTQRGDSGAPVVDVDGRLIGCVLGSDGDHTLVLPASRALFLPHTNCSCKAT